MYILICLYTLLFGESNTILLSNYIPPPKNTQNENSKNSNNNPSPNQPVSAVKGVGLECLFTNSGREEGLAQGRKMPRQREKEERVSIGYLWTLRAGGCAAMSV